MNSIPNISQLKSKYLFYSIAIIVILRPLEYFFDFIPPLVKYFLCAAATILLVISTIKIGRRSALPPITRAFVMLLYLWVLYMIIAATPSLFDSYFNYVTVKQFLSGILYCYMCVFIISMKMDLILLRDIFKIIFIFAPLFIIMIPYVILSGIPKAEAYNSLLVTPLAVLLLTFNYHSTKKNILTFTATVLGLILMMLLARRNAVLFSLSTLLFTILIPMMSNSLFTRQRKIGILSSCVVLLLLLSVPYMLYQDNFNLLFDRVSEGMDSRQDTIDNLKMDLDQTEYAWIFGKGIMGGYEDMGLGEEDRGNQRGLIEHGYYFLILKGGWVFLALLIAISMSAVYKGMFMSRNILSKAFAAYIIIVFISMIAVNQFSLHIRHIFLFISIACCLSKELRDYSDEYIKDIVGLK